MNKKGLIVLVTAVILVLALVASACGPETSPTPTPASSPTPTATPTGGEIEVISVQTDPELQVLVGEPATVIVELRNFGGSEVTYNAKLLVNGVQEQAKDVTLAAGATGTATFTLVKDVAGTYTLSVGGLVSILTVKPQPTPTPTGGGEEEEEMMG